MFFLKRLDILSQCLGTLYNQKSHFLLIGSETRTTSSPSNTKFSLKYFTIPYNHLELFKCEPISIVMPKVQLRQEKKGKILI